MAKGTIVGHLGDAKYDIQLLPDNTRLDAKVVAIDATLASLATEIPAQEAAVDAVEIKRNNAEVALNTSITLYIAGDATFDDVNAATIALIEATGDFAVESRKLADLISKRTSAIKEKQYLQLNKPADEALVAWCADLTEDLSGLVGLVVLPGERFEGTAGGVIVKPGFEGAAVYDEARDGLLQHTISSGPFGAYWNLGALPAWQKYKPLYRVGDLTLLVGNLGDVTLDAVTSSRENLNVNQTDSLSSVPIKYLDCDELAFEVGDRVLVEFIGQDWTTPRIVGFEDNPKPCQPHGFICLPFSDLAPNGWGKPFLDGGGMPINPPLGTTGGTDPSNIVFTGAPLGPYSTLRSVSNDDHGNIEYYGITRNYTVLGPVPRCGYDFIVSLLRSKDIYDRGKIAYTHVGSGSYIAGLSEVVSDNVPILLYIVGIRTPGFNPTRSVFTAYAYAASSAAPAPVLVGQRTLNADDALVNPLFEAQTNGTKFVGNILIRKDFRLVVDNDWSRVHTVFGTITRAIHEDYTLRGDEPAIPNENKFTLQDVLFLNADYTVPTRNPNETIEDFLQRITVVFTTEEDPEADHTVSTLTYNQDADGETLPPFDTDVYDTLDSSYDFTVTRNDSAPVYKFYDRFSGDLTDVTQVSTLNGVVAYVRTRPLGGMSDMSQTSTFTQSDEIQIGGMTLAKNTVTHSGTGAELSQTPNFSELRGTWSYTFEITTLTETLLYFDARINASIINRINFTASLAIDDTVHPDITQADMQALQFFESIVLIHNGVETILDTRILPYDDSADMVTSWDDFILFYNMPPSACISMFDAVTDDTQWSYDPGVIVNTPFNDLIAMNESVSFRNRHTIFPSNNLRMDQYARGGAGWRNGYKEIPFDGDDLGLVMGEYWHRINDFVHELAVAVGVSQWPDEFTSFRTDESKSRRYLKFAPDIKIEGFGTPKTRHFMDSIPKDSFSVDRHGNYFLSFESPLTDGKIINVLLGVVDVDDFMEVQYTDKDTTDYRPLGLV